MSGRWIVLGDTRCNAAAQTDGSTQRVVDCTMRLYSVNLLPEPERSTGEEGGDDE